MQQIKTFGEYSRERLDVLVNTFLSENVESHVLTANAMPLGGSVFYTTTVLYYFYGGTE